MSDDLAAYELGLSNQGFQGYPSDCIDCCLAKAPIGFSATRRRSAKCNDIIKTFIGKGTSLISLDDAIAKAVAEAQKRADDWYSTTACYAPTDIEIVIGGDNL